MGNQALANMVARASQGAMTNDVPQLLERIRQLMEQQQRDTAEILSYTKQPNLVYDFPHK